MTARGEGAGWPYPAPIIPGGAGFASYEPSATGGLGPTRSLGTGSQGPRAKFARRPRPGLPEDGGGGPVAGAEAAPHDWAPQPAPVGPTRARFLPNPVWPPETTNSTTLEADAARRRDFINSSVAKNTFDSYASYWARWEEYCRSRKLSTMPNPNTLSLFLAHFADDFQAVLNAVSGVGFFARRAGMTTAAWSATQSEWLVQATLAGRRKKLVRATGERVHMPAALLWRVITEADLTVWDDLCCSALLAVLFFGCGRPADVVFDKGRSQPAPAVVAERTAVSDTFFDARLTHRKGHLPGQDRLFFTTETAPAWVFGLLQEYASARREKFPDRGGAFFLLHDGRPPADWSLRAWIKPRVPDGMSIKAMRAGSATYYKDLGETEEQIRTRGGWKSAAYLRYLRQRAPGETNLLPRSAWSLSFESSRA